MAAEAAGVRFVVEDGDDRTGEVGRVARGMEKAGPLTVEELRERAMIRSHHRHAGGAGHGCGQRGSACGRRSIAGGTCRNADTRRQPRGA